MTRLAFLAGFLQVTAAFHAGVGVYIAPPIAGKPLFGVIVGVATFVWGAWTNLKDVGTRSVLARLYLLPVGIAATAYVGFTSPGTWDAVTVSAEQFCSEVLARTPRAAYLFAAAAGCFRAQKVRDAAANASTTYYR